MTCSDTGVTTIFDTQNEIFQAATESNCCCQCKTEGTAFRTAPLLQEFGYCSDNKVNVYAVLDRTYVIPPGTDKYAEEFIAALEMTTSIRCKEKITLSVSPEEHKSTWKKQKASIECKTTDRSHEHYKSAIFNKSLNYYNCMMRSILTEIGFVPPTWCAITDVEIQKCSEKIGINDMQLIQLMHPEFQINNKLAGKRVLENAEICNEVANEQHGSRKNHQAGLLALNKYLIGDICRLLRMLACYGINDTIGFFDRIDHIPAIITLMRFGLEYKAAHALIQVIQKSLHCIKTGYGIL